MKNFNGKAIYNPSGKAGEYSYWACNFYVGCSNGCEYCYLKKGRGSAILGGDKPVLKKCFRDTVHALDVFEKELKANISELQKHGLLFSFTTDPMLRATMDLTMSAVMFCVANGVPVKILTKTAFEIGWFRAHFEPVHNDFKRQVAIGFTITGHDEIESFASSNAERIAAMKELHEAGFRTFASVEPIIFLYSAERVVSETAAFCDLYKIGLMSGQKVSAGYSKMLKEFVDTVAVITAINGKKVYFKDSITKHVYVSGYDNVVGRNYNIFNQ